MVGPQVHSRWLIAASGIERSFPVSPRELSCHINISAFRNQAPRKVMTTGSYCFHLSVHVEEIHNKVNLAKRREARKITVGNVVPNVHG